MRRILIFSVMLLVFPIFSHQAFGGTAIKINYATVNLSNPEAPVLVLNGSNFDMGIVYIGLGGLSLSDCAISSTVIECLLSEIPLSTGTWTVNVSAGNAPARNDEIDVFIPVGFGVGCSAGSFVECYTGDPATLGVGGCSSGISTCLVGGIWSECQGEVLPQPEICNDGIDNDCDIEVDCADSDCLSEPACVCLDNVGDPCNTGLQGICAQGHIECTESWESECIADTDPGQVAELCDELDNNCDGQVDEGFDLLSDENNCGACGITCDVVSLDCCNGTCVDLETDEDNCGGCGIPCELGEICINGLCEQSGP